MEIVSVPATGLKDPVDLEMSLDAAEECLKGGSSIALASEVGAKN